MPNEAPTWESTTEAPSWDETTEVKPAAAPKPRAPEFRMVEPGIMAPTFRTSEEAKQYREAALSPKIAIPRIKGRTLAGQIAAAPVNVASGFVESGTTLPGAALLGAGPVAGKVGSALMGAGFGAPMVVQGLKDVYKGTALGEPQQAIEGALGTLAGGEMTAGGLAGLRPEARVSPKAPAAPLSPELEAESKAGPMEVPPEGLRRLRAKVKTTITKPYQAGQQAANAGKSKADNPYVEGSAEEDSWNRGLESGPPPEAGLETTPPVELAGPTTVTTPVTEAVKPTAPAELSVEALRQIKTLTPAVEVGGKVFSGKNHAEVRKQVAQAWRDKQIPDNAYEDFVAAPQDETHQFLADDGKTLLTRKSGAQWFKQKTGKDPGKAGLLHSEDLATEGLLKHLEEKPIATELQELSEAKRRGETLSTAQESRLSELSAQSATANSRAAFEAQLKAGIEKEKAAAAKPAEAPVPPVEAETPTFEPAAAKAQSEVTRVAETEGQRPAKEVKSELVSRLEQAVEEAKPDPEGVWQARRELNTALEKGRQVDLASKALGAALEQSGVGKVTIDIPGDGIFTVWNVKPALEALLERAKRISTTRGEPVKVAKARVSKEDKAWIAAQVEAQRKAQESPTEPTPVGMGAAVSSEFVPPTGTPTGIKNATVDLERQKRGLPPAIEPLRRSFGEVWDRAMAMVDRDPETIDNLLDSLRSKPRALDDTEDALLLHRQVDLQNEYAKATRDLAQAFEDGRTDDVLREKLRVERWSDQLLDLYNIGKRVGTETGRGLAARKMMASEDFTLAKMELDLRSAKGGSPLTAAERAQISDLNRKIAATQKAYDDYRTATDARIADLESKKAVAEIVKDAKRTRVTSKATLEQQRQASLSNIQKKVADGKQKEIAWDVQRLARMFVQAGVAEREALIDAVHQVLQEAIPEITRRETMDAISGYGDYKQLSKDQISVTLRGMKGEMQQLAKLEDMAKGEPPLKSGVQRRTQTEAERKLIKEVNDAKNKFQVPVSDPETQLKSALDTLKTTLTNRIADYQDRLARKDYAPRPRRSIQLDPEASRLKAENERVKKQFQRQVALERMRNRTGVERGADWITRWRRGFILSGPVTLAKLTAAAAQRLTFTPIEEAIGSGFSRALPSIAAKAARESGFNPRAEASALTQALTQGMKDAWQVLRTGQSDLDVLYGREALLSPTAVDFFGHVHGALKAPTKRAEFARSLEKRSASAISNGVDVTDPIVQSRLFIEAYQDANRSIFLQDNRVVAAYRRGLQALEQKNKQTGQVPLGGKAAATAARVLLPIVKVPTNIVAETLQYATGTVTGSARLANAFARGIDTLAPEQADLILRELKKGSLGAAVMLLGYLNPQVIGGYYQPGQKRKPGDVKAGAVRLFGVEIPSFLLHNPLLETMQIGATVRRVADSKLRKGDADTQGIGAGIYAGALGLTTEVPFVRETTEVLKAFNPKQKGAFWGELGKSLLIPQAVQWLANQSDKNAQGNVQRRKPQTVLQHIETGIPYLRQQVPLTKTEPQPQ